MESTDFGSVIITLKNLAFSCEVLWHSTKPRFPGSCLIHHESSSNPAQDRYEKSEPKNRPFSMAILTGSSASTGSVPQSEPLLDDGAPYFAIGLMVVNLLTYHVGLSLNPQLGGISPVLEGHKHLQYGTGEHASPARRILGSFVLSAKSDQGTAHITHLVLDGSSQWTVGRNFTRRANVEAHRKKCSGFPCWRRTRTHIYCQ